MIEWCPSMLEWCPCPPADAHGLLWQTCLAVLHGLRRGLHFGVDAPTAAIAVQKSAEKGSLFGLCHGWHPVCLSRSEPRLRLF